MRTLLTILTLISCQTTFGQFAIISDKDGFVNVRSSAGISNNITDTLTNGQIVFCFEAEKEWFPIEYDLSRQNKSGYIHRTRMKFIEDFKKKSSSNLTDSSILFKSDTLKLTITKTSFNSKTNKLQYHKGNPQENEASYLERINGLEIWGSEGNIPKKQYGQILLELGKKKTQLPIENLFEPNLGYTSLNIDEQNETIYISSLNSDGAGAYAVLWIVKQGNYRQRIITIPF